MNRRTLHLCFSILLALGVLLAFTLGIASARSLPGGDAGPAAKIAAAANVDLTLDIRKAKTGRYKVTYEPGSFILYEIRLRNQGTDAATQVVVTYTLPISVWFSASFNDRGIPYTYTLPSTATQETRLIWDVGTLEAGGERNFYVEMQIYPTATLGLKLDSTAVVTSAEVAPVQAQRTDTVSGPNLKLKKKLLSISPGYLDKDKVLPGQELFYYIEVKNESVVTDARNVIITDTLPAEVTFVKASTNGVYISATHTVTWNVGVVPRGQTQSYLLTVLAPITPALSFENQAEVTTAMTETDTADNNDKSKKVTVTELEPNVAVNYGGVGGSPVAGGAVEVRLDVNNFADRNFARQMPVENVVLTQTLQNGLAYIPTSARVVDKSGGIWPIVPTVVVSGDTTLVWNLGTLPNDPNQKLNDLSIYFWASLPVTASVGSTFDVNAVITTTTQPESTTNDNKDKTTITVEAPRPDLRISKSGCGSPQPGETCSYNLTVENVGNTVITDAIWLDYLPRGTTVLGVNGGGCSPVVGEATHVEQLGGTLGSLVFQTPVATCTLRSLAPGDKVDFTLHVDVSGTLSEGDVLTNTVIVTRTKIVSDVNPGDNRDVRVTTVQKPQAPPPTADTDIRVTKNISGNGDFVQPGAIAVYDVSLHNQSGVTAANTLLTDTVLVHATLLDASGAEGVNPVVISNTASWAGGTRSPGSRFDVVVRARVDATLQAGQSFANLAWATTAITDANIKDNYDLQYNTIAFLPRQSDVRVTKQGAGCFVPGGTATFAIDVENRQAVTATQVVVTDTLAAGLTYQGSTIAPAGTAGPNVVWNFGTLAPNQKVSFDVTVSLDAGLTPGDFLSNTVTVSAANEDVSKLNDNVANYQFQVLATPQADLEVQKRHASLPPDFLYGQLAYQGLAFDYVLSVTHKGNNCSASGVTVQDVLPAGLSYVAASPSPAVVSGQVITWNLGSLPAGASTPITVTVQVAPDVAVGAVLSNRAQVSSSSYDPLPENNIAFFNTAISGPRSLYLPLILK